RAWFADADLRTRLCRDDRGDESRLGHARQPRGDDARAGARRHRGQGRFRAIEGSIGAAVPRHAVAEEVARPSGGAASRTSSTAHSETWSPEHWATVAAR